MKTRYTCTADGLGPRLKGAVIYGKLRDSTLFSSEL